MPAHCLDELLELGFYLPLSAQVAEASATVPPVAGPVTPLSSLATLNKADEPAQSPWALAPETVTLTLPNYDEQSELDNWCKSDLVALPSAADGSTLPLNEDEVADHVNSGHLTKSILCRGCCCSTNHKTTDHIITSRYDLQANGTAERSIGLIKSLAARALSASSLDSLYGHMR